MLTVNEAYFPNGVATSADVYRCLKEHGFPQSFRRADVVDGEWVFGTRIANEHRELCGNQTVPELNRKIP